jgi:hypothetical protein
MPNVPAPPATPPAPELAPPAPEPPAALPPEPTSPEPAPPTPPPEPDPVDQLDDVASLRREAGNRRRALRTAEAENVVLRERSERLERAEVERLVVDRFKDPTDVWSVLSLDTLRGEDGTLDMAKAQTELALLAQQKKHWLKDPVALLANGARTTHDEPRKLSFGEAVKAQRR